uniref:Uncharacterized protein n=1 Tax=Anguilla anguilla TaxID=7936 RepID=A0A0E9X4C0_ANGAN
MELQLIMKVNSKITRSNPQSRVINQSGSRTWTMSALAEAPDGIFRNWAGHVQLCPTNLPKSITPPLPRQENRAIFHFPSELVWFKGSTVIQQLQVMARKGSGAQSSAIALGVCSSGSQTNRQASVCA